MTRIVLIALTGLVLSLVAQPADARLEETSAAAHGARAGEVALGGVDVRLRPRTRQVVTVNRTRGYHARVAYWVLRHGKWRKRFSTGDGRIGYAGLVPRARRVQGSGKTPLGTFGLMWAFGMHRSSDDWGLRYRKVRRGDYWVLDNASDHYNRYRNKRQGGFRWRLPSSDPNSSERLLDYRKQYEWSIVMNFNPNQVRHRGGAIFLHVNGSGATAGCVSVPRRVMKRLMDLLEADRDPVIAVGR
jgi:L,D-peptidoglycan transpeptidase YkuD (ErfK/YbiS/YcfS/YnhG family)